MNKNRNKLSVILQISVLVTFFLPFFPSGCQSNYYKEAEAQRVADSIAASDSIKILNAYDSIFKNHKLINKDSFIGVHFKELRYDDSIREITLKKDTITLKKDSISSKKDTTDSKEIPLSEQLSKKSKLLKTLLRPNDNYSGIGYILDIFYSIIYPGLVWVYIYLVAFGAFISFILFTIGLRLKFKNLYTSSNIINIIAFISLFFARDTLHFSFERLWGYWVCLMLCILMIVLDIHTWIKYKKNKRIYPKN